MIESLIQAKQEMKRLEHVLYVSLKYTRTKDILLNAIYQLNEVIMWCINALIKYHSRNNKIEIPTIPQKKIKFLEEKLGDDFDDFLETARELRSFLKYEFKAEDEFRKNVKIIALDTDHLIEIDMKKLFEYYNITKKFLEKIEEIILEEHRKGETRNS